MPLDQQTRTESNVESNNSSDRQSNLRDSVSNQDMENYIRDNRNSGLINSFREQFGDLEIVDNDNVVATSARTAGTAVSEIGSQNKPEDTLPRRIAAPAFGTYELPLVAQRVFARIDADNNGYLSRTELADAVQSTQFQGQDAQMVAGLYAGREELQTISNDEWGFENDGITMADITRGAELRSQGGSPAGIDTLMEYVRRTQESDENRIVEGLYGDPNDAIASIDPHAVRQGNIGNCYFLASLAALAESNPQAIRDMIRDNGNGSYTVTFPGDRDNPITVNAPTQAELGLYNGGTKFGTWVNVLENAWGEYRSQHGGVLSQISINVIGGGAYTSAEGGGGGGRPEHALRLLTGNGTQTFSPSSFTEQQLAQYLDTALDNGSAITAGINRSLTSDRTQDGFMRAHAYSIIGFERGEDGTGYVTVRNPWGENNESTGGTIRITLAQLQQNFSDVIVEHRAPQAA